MPRVRKVAPPARSHRWYLAEWAAEHEKRQADAIRDLGWSRSSASDLWSNKQRYTQDHVDEVAHWLGIAPYELLLPPNEAKAIRGIRTAALAIVGGEPPAAEVLPLSKTPTRRKR